MKNEKSATIIQIRAKEALLKRRMRRHLSSLGFTRTKDGELCAPGTTKDIIRQMHAPQRKEILRAQSEFIEKKVPRLESCFASGNEITVDKITPRVERVTSGTWQADLFRLASFTWSVPVSSGFGRRLRYLVWDDHNGKLIGIFAIGDPVFNLSARDNAIGWNGTDRTQRLVNVMDAYVLGAIPPYNLLLGGKLIACLIRSRDIYNDFLAVYGSTTGIISQCEKNARLLAVTTSSSMGRSSIYNRLKLGGVPYFSRTGYSGGWGHFHVPEALFNALRTYLREMGHPSADTHGFGDGPNWRIRTIRAAMSLLGFKGDLLKHGIQREVFISFLADNAISLLKNGKGKPKLTNLNSVSGIAELAIERWMIGRAESRREYLDWSATMLPKLLKASYTGREVILSEKSA